MAAREPKGKLMKHDEDQEHVKLILRHTHEITATWLVCCWQANMNIPLIPSFVHECVVINRTRTASMYGTYCIIRHSGTRHARAPAIQGLSGHVSRYHVHCRIIYLPLLKMYADIYTLVAFCVKYIRLLKD